MIYRKCKEEKIFDLKSAKRLLNKWKIAAIIWRVLDHTFVIGSFAASVIVIFISADAKSAHVKITAFSSLAAILTLMGFACKPTKYMKNYRKAFQLLNEALVSNTSKEGKFSDDEKAWNAVIEAIKRGEEYIGITYDLPIEDEEEHSQVRI